MKEFSPDSIKNIALIGHAGSGKTSLNEMLLYAAGSTTRLGKVEEGNTISDYTANEIEKKISISLSASNLVWQNKKINILDCPGFPDFEGEMKAGIHVCDTGVLVVKSVEGVEVGTEHAIDYIKHDNKNFAVVVNKVDHERSDYDNVFNHIHERISKNAVVITYPLNQGMAFDTVVDVLKMKAYTYGAPGSKGVTEIDIPTQHLEKAQEYHTMLLEKIAESDAELMDSYFNDGELTPEELVKGMRLAFHEHAFIPVFAVSSTKGVGVNNFLDFVANYFQTAEDAGEIEAAKKGSGEKVLIKPNPNGEPVLFVFKIISEQHVGELSLFRLYSGTIKAGMDLINNGNDKPERLSQIYILNGHNRQDVSQLVCGDIGAVVKLKDTHTNNTLTSKNYTVVLPHIDFPVPAIRGAIIPKAKGDEDKIAQCLHTLHEEDPSFNVKFDPEIAQTIIYGQGELQLSLAVKRLKERYNVDVDLVEPKIPYREAIKGRADSVEYKHKKQSGGRGQFAHVFFKMEPKPRGEGYEFVDAIVGGVVPGRFIPAVEKGIVEQMVKGVVAGYPVIDVKVTLFDGKHHDVDSDEMSFKLASAQCFRKAFALCKPCLLEPIYEVTIKVPEECMGDVMGDINTKRGRILGMESDGHFQIIKANVPLSELYKYSSTLRSLTSGRGIHFRKFSHYEEVPKDIESKIIDEYNKSRQEED